ncbi:MAG: GGDEF domain-containing protein [Lachnospiraceae bacterium]|nr:GGDEF domain-containing protein [Lachnospiraceae bacterium]
MRKRIAVFISAISLENQQKNIEGILEAAKEENVLCYIFTCHLNFLARRETQEGTYNIMRLPDLRTFDGAILMKNTIQYQPIADELVERIKESNIPAVSIDQEIEGMGSVMLNNLSAQYDVVKHMIEAHGARKLCFIAGYPGNLDGEERKNGFLKCCDDYEIRENDRLIVDGNYSINSGKEAVYRVLKSRYFEERGLPDAFICANDQMAIGAIGALNEMGYSVPEDVAVTGFDGDGIGDAFDPVITTVIKYQATAGRYAVKMLLDRINEKSILLQGKTEFGRSCGCVIKDDTRGRALRGQYVAQTLTLRQSGDFIRNMSSDFAEAKTLESFYKTFRTYVKAGDMKSCFLCMCDEETVFFGENISRLKENARIDLAEVNRRYTEYVSAPVCYVDGSFTEVSSFKSGEVLPREVEEQDGADFYVVAPINYQNCCFGYIVTSNSSFAVQSDLFFSWISNIEVALENIRNYILMNSLMDQLNEMWIYDAMTKLYNRGGFFHIAKEYIKDLSDGEKNAFVIFIDLDGLKAVNDNLGHEVGDVYIRSMGEILRSIKRPKDLAMRYGGDEFVLFGECDEEGVEAKRIISDIEDSMKEYVFGDGAYTLSASIGVSIHKILKAEDLKRIINEADKRMYELKKKKRGKSYEKKIGR